MKHYEIDPNKPFQFLGVEDCGEASCPHCGADGRYIYHWSEYGQVKAAMAGCYQTLTGKVEKGDYEKVMESIAKKQSRNKSLNGWERTILRMQQFKMEGKYSIDWCESKITEALSIRKSFISKW